MQPPHCNAPRRRRLGAAAARLPALNTKQYLAPAFSSARTRILWASCPHTISYKAGAAATAAAVHCTSHARAPGLHGFARWAHYIIADEAAAFPKQGVRTSYETLQQRLANAPTTRRGWWCTQPALGVQQGIMCWASVCWASGLCAKHTVHPSAHPRKTRPVSCCPMQAPRDAPARRPAAERTPISRREIAIRGCMRCAQTQLKRKAHYRTKVRALEVGGRSGARLLAHR